MELHIIPQMESIGLAVFADVPRLGHHRNEVHLVVKGHEAVKQLVAGPDVRQVLGVNRVKSKDAGGFVVLKNG